MSEELRIASVEIEQDDVLSPSVSPRMYLSQREARRAQLFHTAVMVTVGVAAVVLVLFIAIGLLDPQFPARYIALVAVGFMLLALFSLWLSRQGRLYSAVGIYLASVTVAVFIASYFLNGISGPFVVAPIGITLMAGLIGGGKVARWTGLGNAILYLAMTILEGLGILQPWQVSGVPLRLIGSGVFLAAIGTIVVVTGTFVGLTQHALSVAQQRGRELAETIRQAQEAAQAEREAREREERAAQQLRQAVEEYTAFLERVATGDYSAMLALDEADQGEEGVRELRILGDYLNATVETLVTALSGMQVSQQRYLRDAWESFAQTRAVHRGFRYHVPSADSGRSAAVEPADEAWLTPMAKAVRDKDMTVGERELALPITLRGQIIGAIGACRPSASRRARDSAGSGSREELIGWSDEDVALAQVITDQLAQTIESLRLLDETQRRAARERLTSEVTARVRETLDMETVLKTAVQEVRQALGLPEVVVRLAPQPSDKGKESSQ
jgi:hypothetical protein